jgi:hypothetical protein
MATPISSDHSGVVAFRTPCHPGVEGLLPDAEDGLDLRRRLADRLREDHPAVGDLSPTQQAALLRLLRALDL